MPVIGSTVIVLVIVRSTGALTAGVALPEVRSYYYSMPLDYSIVGIVVYFRQVPFHCKNIYTDINK
eukprot:gene2440-1535_t